MPERKEIKKPEEKEAPEYRFQSLGKVLRPLLNLIENRKRRRMRGKWKQFYQKELKQFEDDYRSLEGIVSREGRLPDLPLEEIIGKSRDFDLENYKEGFPELEEKGGLERRVAEEGLNVLRFMAYKGGEISKKTYDLYFNETRKKAAEELLEEDWMEEMHLKPFSNEFLAVLALSTSYIGIGVCAGLSYAFGQMGLAGLAEKAALWEWIFLPSALTPSIAIGLLEKTGTLNLYGIIKDNLKLKPKSVKLLGEWSKATEEPLKLYEGFERVKEPEPFYKSLPGL